MSNTNDLARLFDDNEQRDSIQKACDILHTRFSQDRPYTQLGHHRLLVVNPFKQLELLNDSALQHHANQGYKDLSEQATSDPHIYEFATRAYYIMRRRTDDVGIILNGFTGSGKSTTHQHLLNELLHLSAQTRREEKLRRYVLSAQTIIDCLSTGATSDNANASHLHQFQTLYFNERGRIQGIHTAVYLLDKFRVTQGDANYSLFYQLLAGTSQQEKQALHINHTVDHFAYLKDSHGLRNAAPWTNVQSRDEVVFGDFKSALKTCGFKAKTIAQICQLLGAILHLGNIQFVGNNQSCKIKNKDTLSLVAAALGVATAKLEATLTHKLKLLGKEFCTAFLTADAATVQRDALARALYTILVLWIVDALNKHHPATSDQCISILDNGFASTGGFTDLCAHFCAERIHQFIITKPHLMDAPPPASSSLTVYLGNHGLVSLLNRESERLQAYALDATDTNFLSLLVKKQPHVVSKNSNTFAIQHFAGPVEYTADGFLESNLDALSPDFILLFRYSCTNTFLRELFESSVLVTEMHPRDERTIIKAQLPTRPMLGQWRPTDPAQKDSKMMTVMDQMVHSMDSLIDRLKRMQLFEIIHIRPNNEQKPDLFDPNIVMQQLIAHKIADKAKLDPMYSYEFGDFLSRYHYLMSMLPFDEETHEDERTKITKLIHVMQWTKEQVDMGKTCIWIAFDVWRDLENHLRMLEKEQRIREREERIAAAIEAENEAARLAAEEAEAAAAAAAAAAAVAAENEDGSVGADQNPFGDPDHHDCGASDVYTTDNDFYDDRTEVGDQHGSDIMGKQSSSQWGEDEDMEGYMDQYGPNMDMSKMVEDYCVQPEELIEEVPITRIRQWWARFVWFCTWWIPSVALRYIGKMHRQDVRMAWREKVTLCMLIFSLSASIIFFIVGLGEVICPGTKDLYSAQDVVGHQTMSDYWVSVRGKVYDMTNFVSNTHGTNAYVATKSTLEPLAGRDLSYTFPPPLTQACQGLVTDNTITVTPNETIVLGPFVHFSGGQQNEKTLVRMQDPDWLERYFMPVMNPNKQGDLVISKKQLKEDFESWGRLALAIDGKVYDLTDYMATARKYPRDAVGVSNYHYLHEAVEHMFTKYAGTDATETWKQFSAKMNAEELAANQACLENAFYVARLDYRDSLRCTFVNYLLLSFAVVTSVVILVKFLAALQFGGAPTPEEQDKFVICQVPCYTEDEESLRKTVDSLTTMDYDDNRKLLFLVADGMIIGSGNDKPTPMILLDILGHDDKDDPEPVMFKSVGEGSKQLNYGKVYSGLYMHEGHCVPYIVVIKVGKSTERTKPGNRGKRDSQIICMDFLRKVHFDSEMTPLELAIYHNIRNVIGVDPALYEYILMVDSDTEVYPDALTRLVSCMLHDSRIIGLCGETELCNEDRSWTTRIQVYEYYISHHLVKAFESLFGSVTCLPGCFCMYRIRTASKRQPLIVSPAIIHGYSDNQVDTLHKKNLLHLGEDRYLTTLMMKNFPQYKMMFTPYARCRTVAPDRWQVLLSQRRRWINSTIHNLLELILLPELCGFCCLSMRFVVMIDLIGTITLPASVIYLVYLIYIVAANTSPIPVIALGMLAGAYGLQALIFIVKRQWQHIGWMVIYLLAIPVFSFLIPIYAFWHFDDFSWGNTRVVVGDKKKQIIVTEDEKFDDKMIPMKKWEQYEQEMLETKSIESDATKHTNYTYDSRPLSDSYRGQQDKDENVPRLATGLSERRLSQFSVDLSTVLHPHQEASNDNNSTHGSSNEEPKAVLPEDDEIERELRRILATANLMTLTKKQVRIQLSQRFGVDLTIKKGFINSAIERILENEM